MKILISLFIALGVSNAVTAKPVRWEHILFKVTGADVVSLARFDDKPACDAAIKAIRDIRVKVNLTTKEIRHNLVCVAVSTGPE